LSKELGIKVNLRVANDYRRPSSRASAAGNIQIGYYGPGVLCAGTAYRRSRPTRFVIDVNADGSKGYYFGILRSRQEPVSEA